MRYTLCREIGSVVVFFSFLRVPIKCYSFQITAILCCALNYNNNHKKCRKSAFLFVDDKNNCIHTRQHTHSRQQQILSDLAVFFFFLYLFRCLFHNSYGILVWFYTISLDGGATNRSVDSIVSLYMCVLVFVSIYKDALKNTLYYSVYFIREKKKNKSFSILDAAFSFYTYKYSIIIKTIINIPSL